jgi:hypothetical protein
MSNYLKIIVFFSAICLSCEKEERPQSIREITVSRYKEILAKLDIGCPNETSESFFKATLGGKKVCYYDGVEGLYAQMAKIVTFTTPSPSFNTNTTYSNAANYFEFGFLDFPHTKAFIDKIEFRTPHYVIGSDPEKYLDSLFSIKEHLLREKEDEVDKFAVSLVIDYPHVYNSFQRFDIATYFGNQDDGKLIINEVKKFREDDELYYDLEITINCTLYHWPQTAKIGAWGKIENGHLHARFKPEFYN